MRVIRGRTSPEPDLQLVLQARHGQVLGLENPLQSIDGERVDLGEDASYQVTLDCVCAIRRGHWEERPTTVQLGRCDDAIESKKAQLTRASDSTSRPLWLQKWMQESVVAVVSGAIDVGWRASFFHALRRLRRLRHLRSRPASRDCL